MTSVCTAKVNHSQFEITNPLMQVTPVSTGCIRLFAAAAVFLMNVFNLYVQLFEGKESSRISGSNANGVASEWLFSLKSMLTHKRSAPLFEIWVGKITCSVLQRESFPILRDCRLRVSYNQTVIIVAHESCLLLLCPDVPLEIPGSLASHLMRQLPPVNGSRRTK